MAISPATFAAIRFGYGFHPRQVPPGGPDDLIGQLDAGARAPLIFPVASSIERREVLDRYIGARHDPARRREQKKVMRREALQDAAHRVLQRALSPNGLHERMAAFWSDHFTVAARNLDQLYKIAPFEIEAVRPHITGRFADMLRAAVQHPAMLHYLDQSASFGPNSPAGRRRGVGLNENLAREVLELHTLGVDGPYTQADVREFAELLTGYGAQHGYRNFRFFPGRAEPGSEVVLGKRYGGDPARVGDAVEFLEDLARHPVTARHLAGKLATHFVADKPDPDLVSHIAAAWLDSGGDLSRVYEALLEHPAAWRGFGAKVKQPVDLVASTLRAAGMTRAQADRTPERTAKRIFRALGRMNQPMFRAPGPNGWPEEAAAWITPPGLAARLNFASAVGHIIAKRGDRDPRRFARAALHDALRKETAFAVGAAPERWEGFALTLASPEFNRR